MTKIWSSISSFHYSFGVLLEAGIGPSLNSSSVASFSVPISCFLDANGFSPPKISVDYLIYKAHLATEKVHTPRGYSVIHDFRGNQNNINQSWILFAFLF